MDDNLPIEGITVHARHGNRNSFEVGRDAVDEVVHQRMLEKDTEPLYKRLLRYSWSISSRAAIGASLGAMILPKDGGIIGAIQGAGMGLVEVLQDHYYKDNNPDQTLEEVLDDRDRHEEIQKIEYKHDESPRSDAEAKAVYVFRDMLLRKPLTTFAPVALALVANYQVAKIGGIALITEFLASLGKYAQDQIRTQRTENQIAATYQTASRIDRDGTIQGTSHTPQPTVADLAEQQRNTALMIVDPAMPVPDYLLDARAIYEAGAEPEISYGSPFGEWFQEDPETDLVPTRVEPTYEPATPRRRLLTGSK
jgi:hypothetical protein